MSGAWLVLFIGLWVVCMLLAVLVVGLSRRIQSLESNGFISRAASARAEVTRDVAEQFLGKQLAERAVESGIEGLAGGLAGVILFVSEHCGPCQALAADLATELTKLGRSEEDGLAELLDGRVTIVTDQTGAFDRLGATAVIIDSDGSVMNNFAVTATPIGIALDDDGVVIAASLANDLRDVRTLARAAQPPRLEVAVYS
jgi:hypothetical protein